MSLKEKKILKRINLLHVAICSAGEESHVFKIIFFYMFSIASAECVLKLQFLSDQECTPLKGGKQQIYAYEFILRLDPWMVELHVQESNSTMKKICFNAPYKSMRILEETSRAVFCVVFTIGDNKSAYNCFLQCFIIEIVFTQQTLEYGKHFYVFFVNNHSIRWIQNLTISKRSKCLSKK